MSEDEPPGSEGTRAGPHESQPTLWVVGDGDGECDHPVDALRELGVDGLNGFYRCDRCEATIVVQNGVDYLVQ